MSLFELMSHIVAIRKENVKFEGVVTYNFCDDQRGTFNVLENTNLVDGIGGVTWDGALILCRVLELMAKQGGDTHVVELGCGTGLCGIVAGRLGCKSTLTDRCADLAKINVDMVVTQARNGTEGTEVDMDIRVFDMPWESSVAAASNRDPTEDADGEEPVVSVKSVLSLRGKVDLIVGAEITCLRKQQGLLVDTVLQLTEQNPNAVVLFSFDSAPQPNGCLYEQDMIDRMSAIGFTHSVVFVAGCVWVTEQIAQDAKEVGDDALPMQKVSKAYLIDRTQEFKTSSQRLHFPIYSSNGTASRVSSGESQGANNSWSVAPHADTAYCPISETERASLALLPPLAPPVKRAVESRVEQVNVGSSTTTTTNEEGLHHIIAFYRPAAIRTCQRCHQQYFAHTSFNPPHACRYHSGYFVCRWHPAETKCSIGGHGDGLGYYGNGQEHYKAEFWDCCGSEDRSAAGCCSDSHVPY